MDSSCGGSVFTHGDRLSTKSLGQNYIENSMSIQSNFPMTLQMESPLKVLYGKKVDQYQLKIIGSRAFVYIEIMGTPLWAGCCVGLKLKESNSYGVWNLRIRCVIETWNVVIIETTPYPIQGQ